MDNQTQDIAWRCLPSEFREEAKRMFEAHMMLDNYEEAGILCNLFGELNLTSDTEPDEMLTILRKDIIEEYKQATADLSRTGNLEYKGKREILKNLFGDKCLPDPTVLNVPSGGGGMSLTPPSYKLDVETDKEVLTAENATESVIAQPKTLNVGDKVKIIGSGTEAGKARVGEIGEILDIDLRDNACFVFWSKGQDWVRACDLEPYKELEQRLEQPSVQVEPKFKVGDKVRVLGGLANKDMEGKMAFVTRLPQGNCNKFVVTFENGLWTELSEKYLEPYTEPETKVPDNRKILYDALCELESASAKVRKALISLG